MTVTCWLCFRLSQEADETNQYDYTSINSARSDVWIGLWNFVDRKVDSGLTEVFRLNTDFVMALLVLLARRLFASDQPEKAKQIGLTIPSARGRTT
jgi:hypothetical protein